MKKALFPLCFIFLFSACNQIGQEDVPYVKVSDVKFQTLNKQKTLQGYIDRGYDVELSFGLSGIIKKFFVIEGQYVKKGALLSVLDNDEYKFEILRAQSELDNAVIKHNRAKSYYERISKLHSAGGISYNDWEAAQTDLKSSLNQIDILKNALNIAKNKETFSNIHAPFDGYVIKTFKDGGQFAPAGEKVILFQGKGALEARVFASQDDINKIKVGQDVILKADATGDKKYPGKVKSKVNSSINTGSYRVTVSILEDDKELLDGMSVDVTFLDKKEKCKIVIPLNSILFKENDSFVFVVDKTGDNKGIVLKRKVYTGNIYDDKIEILDGLYIGETFVTDGINRIMDGSKVEFNGKFN